MNAVSKHATCSVAFGFVAYFAIATTASIRKIHKLGWITWVGFGSIVSAILTVVIAVTVPDRPAAAPRTGDFVLGFAALPPAGTTFAAAWAASLAIFSSSANTSGFVSSWCQDVSSHEVGNAECSVLGSRYFGDEAATGLL